MKVRVPLLCRLVRCVPEPRATAKHGVSPCRESIIARFERLPECKTYSTLTYASVSGLTFLGSGAGSASLASHYGQGQRRGTRTERYAASFLRYQGWKMKAKPPLKPRRFASDWAEVEYLYDKLLYWLYERESLGKARPYAERLRRLLPKVDPRHESIFGEECWSLVYESKRDVSKAIEHRENEIRRMRRLHEVSHQAANGNIELEGRGYEALSDRLDLLASLYHDSGDLDRAIAILQESKQVCAEHRLDFDGSDMLEEYLTEQTNRRSSK